MLNIPTYPIDMHLHLIVHSIIYIYIWTCRILDTIVFELSFES